MLSLNHELGTLPRGTVAPLTDDQLSRVLRDDYIFNKAEIARQDAMRVRLDFFHDRGQRHINAVIDQVFKNAKVIELRKRVVNLSLFQNLTKRIIREVSAVYSEPATRKVKQANERYKELQRVCRLDRVMRAVNQRTNLLNNVLVWPDIVGGSIEPQIDGEPVVRFVTPDKFWAIAHPNDPRRAVGYIVEQFPTGAGVTGNSPHYLVMDAVSFRKLDKSGRFVEFQIRPHNLGSLPALLTSKGEGGPLLDSDSGEDLISAQKAVALLLVMMLKHQKSGTKQAYATGDMSTTAQGQALDEESLLQLGEGVSLNTLDLGSNPDNYIKAVREVLKQISANWGIPASVFDLSYQATSGFEIELKRVGLREVRRDQILDYRPLERSLAERQSTLLSVANHPLAFKTNGWGIDFGEVETPQDPDKRIAYWEKLEKMGLINRVQMYLWMNPEATEAEAAKVIDANIGMRISTMRKFQSANPGTFGPAESANPPTDRDGNRLSVVEDEEDAA